MSAVCVFCGSNPGNRPAYREAAEQFGAELVKRQRTLVFGGGSVGLMGILADSVLRRGGDVVGVMPRSLVEREIAHRGATRMHVVETMHERKQLMADLSDAFVLLPGGFGSWDEFCEVMTWAQLGIHRKPLGILNVAKYYAPLLALAEHSVQEGFVRAAHWDTIVVDDDSSRLLDRLAAAPVAEDVKWTPPPE